MATTTPIARIKLTPKPPIDREDKIFALANEAAEVLGYKGLKQKVIVSTPLRNALSRLDIDILDTAQVKKYQNTALADIMKFGSSYGWQKGAIAAYDKPIPEFALRKAIAIKRELNHVDIYVESLKYYPDPFLVVKTTGQYDRVQDLYSTEPEEYYIEVWDEPKFEASL